MYGARLQIINLAKNIKTPSLTVYLVGDAARDREAAKNVQCSLEYTTLRRVTEATEIHYDPDPEVRARVCARASHPRGPGCHGACLHTRACCTGVVKRCQLAGGCGRAVRLACEAVVLARCPEPVPSASGAHTLHQRQRPCTSSHSGP